MKTAGHIINAIVFAGLAFSLGSNASAADDKPSMALKIHFPKDALALTHTNSIPFWYAPPDIEPLTDKALENSLSLLAKVRDETGEVIGIGAEYENMVGATGPNGKPAILTYWLIYFPGRGSIFLSGHEQVPEDIWRAMEDVIKTGKEWTGNRTWTSTVGPLPNGRGRIIGGDGEFANIKGSYVEMDGMVRFPADATLNGDMDILLYFEGR